MKILYVDLDHEWRGGQSQALLTVRGLRAKGHEAELVAVRDSPLARRTAAAGVPVHPVGARARRARAAMLLRSLVSRQGFDLLHANEPHALTAAWAAGAHRRLPVVVSRRVAFPLHSGLLALSRYRAARQILAISRFVAESVRNSGIAPEKIEIVHEGVEVPPLPALEVRERARRRWGVLENEPLFACVGYLLPEKGQESLIRGLPAVRAEFPECRVLLAGDGRSRARLEDLARELGLASAVIFAGFVEDVSEVYAATDVFVFPSLAEPLGTSLLAAMAYGLPVAAVASGGVPEYVEDGRNGLLVARPEAALLAAAVRRLLRDAAFAKQLGAAARLTIEQRFTAEHMVARTLRAYERLAG